jgi:hypothetical protein
MKRPRIFSASFFWERENVDRAGGTPSLIGELEVPAATKTRENTHPSDSRIALWRQLQKRPPQKAAATKATEKPHAAIQIIG